MLPQLMGFAVFGAIFAWTQSLGQEAEHSDPKLADKKYPKRHSYPTRLEFLRDTSSDPEKMEEAPVDPGPPVNTRDAIQNLSDIICRKVMACPEIPPEMTWNNCLETVQGDGYIANKFGISSRLSFQKVIEGEGLGYRIGAKDLERCSEEVEKLACENLLMEELDYVFPSLEDNGEGNEDQDTSLEEVTRTRIVTRFDGDSASACGDAFKPEPVSCDISESQVEVTHPAVQRLVEVMCSSLATCNPGLECAPCFERALSNHRFADRIGLNRVDLQEIDFGLGLGLYLSNEDNLNRCLEELENTACYQTPSHPLGLPGMIPQDSEACARIFEKPKTSCGVEGGDPLNSFAQSMCETIITCRPEIPCDYCMDRVMESSAVAMALGLKKDFEQWKAWQKAGEDLSLKGMEAFLQQGRLSLDQAALEQCANDISEQTCIKIQLGPGDFDPEGHRPLIPGVMRLFQGGTGSCKLALNYPGSSE